MKGGRPVALLSLWPSNGPDHCAPAARLTRVNRASRTASRDDASAGPARRSVAVAVPWPWGRGAVARRRPLSGDVAAAAVARHAHVIPTQRPTSPTGSAPQRDEPTVSRHQLPALFCCIVGTREAFPRGRCFRSTGPYRLLLITATRWRVGGLLRPLRLWPLFRLCRLRCASTTMAFLGACGACNDENATQRLAHTHTHTHTQNRRCGPTEK